MSIQDSGYHYPDTPPLRFSSQELSDSTISVASTSKSQIQKGLYQTLIANSNPSSSIQNNVAALSASRAPTYPRHTKRARRTKRSKAEAPSIKRARMHRSKTTSDLSSLENKALAIKSKPSSTLSNSQSSENIPTASELKSRKATLESRFHRLSKALAEYYSSQMEKAEHGIHTNKHPVINQELQLFAADYDYRIRISTNSATLIQRQLEHYLSYRLQTISKNYQRYAMLIRQHLLCKTMKRYQNLCGRRLYDNMTPISNPSTTQQEFKPAQQISESTLPRVAPIFLPQIPSVLSDQQALDDLALCNV
ncbi:Clr6 histone deacetylase complex subunit Mug165 [Schizosaccharomyces osmophilus]|uniref:Clr6 histone deacetylase complex subunit Mug165 n=1 Tax=Schizosaccharomyces osmophilus TaxID=2545709 RepID=A0AAF0ATG4_9SCHI|nr:Clr6 histone deacetylase complex subunit Mug165 [Schizosaccharomyces osmophilus]WBW71476.1 Clr6 histone deacetylase complex subunit Mug165 [Schizosaccharomyces osmophilus]